MSEKKVPTLTVERQMAIATQIAEDGAVRVVDLAELFDVSPATIRRDLLALEEQGKIERVHGGALPVEPEKAGPEAQPVGSQEARIGQAVADLISDSETVFLSPGQLSLAVVQCLGDHSRLTIVTNGLEVAYWAAQHLPHTLIVTGGQVEARDMGLVGHLVQMALDDLRADHVVLDLGGISAVGGLTDDSLPQAEIAQHLMGTGAQIILLVAADRVGREAAAYVGAVADADILVTAREAPSAFLWDLSQVGIRIVLA